MKKKSYQIFMFFLLTCGVVFGQQQITGTVSDKNGPLPGVSVSVKNSSRGVTTDFDGKYTIQASQGETLVFSFLGMDKKEVVVGDRTTINVELQESSTQLSEVVVVGYGTQSREKVTGSVSIIDTEELENIPAASFQTALQGASPGLQVVSNDGSPGAGISVRVRGIGSINANNEPLYVIDGMPVTAGSVSQTDFGNGGRSSNVLASLNPNDIESLVVLKDAASTAIYGSRGANGVVLITTKSGKTGKPTFSLKARVGISDYAFNNLLEPLNGDQYHQLYVEGYVNSGRFTAQEAEDRFQNQFPTNPETGTYYSTNWIDAISRTGITQEYDFNVSGGTENIKYYVSTNYFDQEGVVVNNNFERFSTRANLDIKLTEKLRFTNSFSLSKFDQRGITDGTRWQAPFYLGYLMAPAVPIFDEQGRYYGEHTFFMGANNPVGHLYDDRRELGQTRMMDAFDLSYELMDGLIFKSSWSFDLLRVDEYLYSNMRYGDGRNVGGSAEEARTNEVNWLGTQSLNYSTTFNDDHNLSVLAAYEAQKVNRDIVEAAGEGFSHPDLRNLQSAANPTVASSTRTHYAFNSYFARANYDFRNTYFLSGSVRRDGSSRFGPDKRWGTFWSVGGGYTISNESFLVDSDVITFLKLRASYGITGNAGIGNFNWAGLWGFNRSYDGQPGGGPSQVPNPLLTWESQANFNIGLDFRLFKDRLNASVEYFERKSTDLLLDRPLSLTVGLPSVDQNVGDMLNRGVEVSLGGEIVKSDDLNISANVNSTFIKNEITFLPEPINDGTKRREEGRDFQEYYLLGWAGVDPANGDPLWYTDETRSQTTNNVSDAEKFYDGKSATPKMYGGFNLNASYKGFSLGLFFNYQFGNYLYDAPGWVIHGDGRFTPRSTSVYAFENRWTTPGQEAKFPQHRWGGNQSSNQRDSDRYLFEGDFIRLKRLSFAYNLPENVTEKLRAKSLQLNVSLNNYWTWVSDDELYFDPEQTTSGVYNTVTPNTKTINFGVNLTF